MGIKPKVSIVIPSYNQGCYIEETILSVLNQSYQLIEIIIIDGGSVDNSVEVIKKYEDKITYWISEPDNGQADAINKGFEKASGDLLCWVNSDDILYPDFIKRRVLEFSQFPDVVMIYGDVDQGWDLDSKILRRGSQQAWENMIQSCIVRVPQMSALWKKEVYETLGGLDTTLKVLLDWEYFVRIANNYKILYIPGAVAFFRQHDLSKSNNLNTLWAEEMISYYENNIFKMHDCKNINYKHICQNLFFVCSDIHSESNELVVSRKYLKIAKEQGILRFYKIHLFKKTVNGLVKIKKKIAP
jgi:glycosyltransferase involved in cell wall biosynthesis